MPFGSSCGYLSRRILKSQRLKKKCNKGVTLWISRHFHQKGRKYLIFVCLFICPFLPSNWGPIWRKAGNLLSYLLNRQRREHAVLSHPWAIFYAYLSGHMNFYKNYTHVYQNVYHETICTPSAARDSPRSRDQIFLHVYQRAYLII